MAKKQQTLTDQLRAAILNADVTRYRISQDTGIGESVLSRFVNGHAGLSLKALDTLGKYLELELVAMKTSRRNRR